MTKTIHRKEYQAILTALVEAREAKGMTQAQLAKALKKPQSYISKIENGERRIDIIELMDICGVMGVSFLRVVKNFLDIK